MEKNIQNALEATEGTGIGVMDENGRILKKARRKKKQGEWKYKEELICLNIIYIELYHSRKIN